METATLPSSLLADYEVLETLRHGAHSSSVKARQRGTDHLRVLKFQRGRAVGTDAQRLHFAEQINELARYRPEQFGRIDEIASDDEGVTVVRHFVDGEALEERLLSGPLAPRDAAQLAERIANALDFAHENKVYHLQLRASNVIQRPDGAATLVDFACPVAATHLTAEAAPVRVEQVAALAPERIAAPDAPAQASEDVWALGVVLYRMLTGSQPFAARTPTTWCQAVQKTEPPLPSEYHSRIPAGLEAVCLKCLEKDPARRYSTAYLVAKDLERFLAGKSVQAPLRSSRLNRFLRKPVLLGLLACIGLMLVTMAAGGYFAFVKMQETERRATDEVAQGRKEVAEMASERDQVRTALEREQQISMRIFEDSERREREALEATRRSEAAARRRVDQALYARQISRIERLWGEHQLDHVARNLEECRWDLCAWEYDYLRHLLRGSGVNYAAHADAVPALALSPDGKQLATGSKDTTVKLWDVATGTMVRSLAGHTLEVLALAYHPTEPRLASAGADQTILVTALEGRRPPIVLKGHTGSVRAVCFTADGKHLASAAEDMTIKIWDWAAGKEVRTLKGHTQIVTGLVLCNNGSTLASCSPDRTLRVWNVDKTDPQSTFKAETPLTCLAVSADGKRLLTGNDDGGAQVWEVATGKPLLTLRGQQQTVRAVAFSRDDKLLVTAGDDRTVAVWDATTGAELTRLRGHQKSVLAALFDPTGAFVVSGSGEATVRRWEWRMPPAGPVLQLPKIELRQLCLDPGGNTVLAVGSDGEVRLWDVSTRKAKSFLVGLKSPTALALSNDGKQLAVAGIGKMIEFHHLASGDVQAGVKANVGGTTALCYSPDGKFLAAGGVDGKILYWELATGLGGEPMIPGGGAVTALAIDPAGKYLASVSEDGTVKVWEALAAQEALVLPTSEHKAMAVVYSPDGQYLATAGGDGTIRLWDARSGKEEQVLRGHSDSVLSLTYSPDGQRLVSGGADGTLRVWDTQTADELLVLRGHAGAVNGVRFGGDGKRIISAGKDGTLRVWEGDIPGKARFSRGQKGGINCLARSPDGKFAATGAAERLLTVWDLTSGLPLFRVPAHASGVLAVAIHPEGKYVASAGEDQTVVIWEMPHGKQLLTLRGHQRGVSCLAYSPDGKRLVTGSWDNTVRVWEVATGKELHQFKDHTSSVHGVAFSPDGKSVASGSYDSTVRIYDLASGKSQVLQGHRKDIHCLAWSPDGMYLASGDETGLAIVWDARQGKAMTRLNHPGGAVFSVAFRDDSKALLTGCGDNRIRWFEIGSEQPALTVQDHTERVTGLAFRKDRGFLSVAYDGTFKVWEVAPKPQGK